MAECWELIIHLLLALEKCSFRYLIQDTSIAMNFKRAQIASLNKIHNHAKICKDVSSIEIGGMSTIYFLTVKASKF